MTTAHTYRGAERSLEPGTPDWTGAACIPPDDDLFFVDDYSGTAAVLATEEAKRICNQLCPRAVRDQCRAFAIEQRIPFGVFGGLTAAERGASNLRTCETCGKPLTDPNSKARYCDGCRHLARSRTVHRYEAERAAVYPWRQ